jgi:hypothetical protein
MIANDGTTATFTALLGGAAVEAFSAAPSVSALTNYYGFAGITFDQIHVHVKVVEKVGQIDFVVNHPMLLDNLQFGNSAQAVPEPASLSIVGIGALGMCGYVWRRRKGLAA